MSCVTGGTPPYGYNRVAIDQRTANKRDLRYGDRYIPQQEKVLWEPGDPAEVETVRFIFEERAQGRSYGRIAEQLNRKEIPCSQYKFGKNNPHIWSTQTVREIITNETYYGARRWGKMTISKIRAKEKGLFVNPEIKKLSFKNDQKDWIITPGAHPAIVSKELWDKANSINTGVIKRDGRKRTSRYLLSGIMKCSECGNSFTGFSTESKGYRYCSYTDAGRFNRGICKSLFIRQEIAERFAVSAVLQTLKDPRIINEIEGHLLHLLKAHPKVKTEEIKVIKAEKGKCELSKKRIVEAIKQGGDIPVLVMQLKELEEEFTNLSTKIVTLENQQPYKLDAGRTSDEVKAFISDFETQIAKAPMEERQLLMRKCIEKAIVDRKTHVIRFYVRKLPAVNHELETLLRQTNGRCKSAADNVARESETSLSMTKAFEMRIPDTGSRHQGDASHN